MVVYMFSWVDYVLFSAMLISSALIGVYFGFYEKKQNNTTEYLLGGKTMNIFPIAMSLLASHMSGITMLGIPSEVYTHGVYYSMCYMTAIFCAIIVAFVYLPVFYKLQLSCSFDYLKMRFDKRCQTLASFIYALAMILYMPLVIYVPALAFSQVTGLSIHAITPITCIICIFYTTVGGLKAVVWTDALQMCITMGAMLAVVILGIKAGGGLNHILDIADQGERMEFIDWTLDPTVRTSVWGIVIGMTVGWVQYIGVSQASVQRFLAVPTLNAAKKSVLYLCIGHLLIKIITCFFGLLLYSQYADCDPLSSGKIVRNDQILPFYVMEIAGHIPGLPGLFTAGVFCAALSTMSSGLNSLAGIIYEDYISPFMPVTTTEKRASDIMKLIVVLLGTLSIGMVFFVQKMGGIFQLSFSLGGITGGPILGLYTLGMLFPSANKKGAFAGAVSSLLFMTVMILGTQYYISQGYHHPTKPLSVEGCNETIAIANNTISALIDEKHIVPPFFFRITFYYYALIGCTVVITIGLAVSWMSSPQKVNRDYLSPVIYWLLPEEKEPIEYKSVKKDFNPEDLL